MMPAYGTNACDQAQPVDEKTVVSSRSLNAIRKQTIVSPASIAITPALTAGITRRGTRLAAFRSAMFGPMAVSVLTLFLFKRMTGELQLREHTHGSDFV